MEKPSMAKKMVNDVQKKKIMKLRNKKLIHKVVHYLKSDSYLFAPLISSKPLDPRKGIEIREPTKDNRSFLKKIKEYLKSDCYMYASLMLPQSSTISPKGSIEYVKKVTNLEVDWKKTSIMKLDDKLVKESAEHRNFKAAEQQKKLLEEPLESTLYSNCRTSSRSGEGGRMVFDHRIRKIVVD